MRKYETIFISDPDLKDQARQELFDKVRDIIAKENGILLDFDEWGNKKLAYEIKKKLRGHYVCVTFGGTGELIKELERNFGLSDHVLKYMTLLLSDNVTAEQLEQEVREAKEQSEQAEKAIEERAAAKATATEETATEKVVEETATEKVVEETATEEVVEETATEEAAEEKTSKKDEEVEETE